MPDKKETLDNLKSRYNITSGSKIDHEAILARFNQRHPDKVVPKPETIPSSPRDVFHDYLKRELKDIDLETCATREDYLERLRKAGYDHYRDGLEKINNFVDNLSKKPGFNAEPGYKLN